MFQQKMFEPSLSRCSQCPRVKWSISESRYFRYSQCLGFKYCEMLGVLALLRDSVLRILPYSQHSEVQHYCTSKHFRVLYCGYCQVPAVFRPLVLRVLECAVYSAVRGIPEPSVHRFDNCTPLLLQKTFTDGPTCGSWGKLLSGGGATGVLESTSSISGVYTASTRSIHGFNTLGTLGTSSISDVCYRGYCLYSEFCTAHTPNTRGIWAFNTAHTPSVRSIWAVSTAILLVLGVPKCPRYSECIIGVRSILGA